jgi:DNA-binding transcriptional ArsR family regulator
MPRPRRPGGAPIVARLAAGDATVLRGRAFDISLPAISRHLKVLEQAGLIKRGRDAQRRPCSLDPEALASATEWIDHTRKVWEDRFDRLADYLKQLQEEAPKEKPHDRKRR